MIDLNTAVEQIVAQEQGWPEPTATKPTVEDLVNWEYFGSCEATDGCMVEPDGVCEHGHPSWLLRLGLI